MTVHRVAAVTIVGSNYLGRASVLASSVREYAPDWDFFTLVVDVSTPEELEEAGVGTPLDCEAVGIDPTRLAVMSFLYNITEFCTAMKPSALKWLLDKGYDRVLYLDPDTQLFNSPAPIMNMLDHHAVALTPHSLAPIPEDGREPSHDTIRGCGSFNLGFFAGTDESRPLLDWWEEMVYLGAGIEVEQNRFTDQRWMDLAPSYADVGVIRHRGVNVAYWNLHERTLARASDGAVLVDGEPLVLFHFSGYEPEKPWRLSKYTLSRPRVFLGEDPVLTGLCDDYRAGLLAWSSSPRHEVLLGREYRRAHLPLVPQPVDIVRSSLRTLLRYDTIAGLDPLRESGGRSPESRLQDWLLSPPTDAPPFSRLPRIVFSAWMSRPDLQVAFADPFGVDEEPLLAWAATSGPGEAGLPERVGDLLLTHSAVDMDGPPAGVSQTAVNVVGYLESESGVGEAGRKMLAALEGAGFEAQPVVSLDTSSRRSSRFRFDPPAAVGTRTVWCVNADQIGLARSRNLRVASHSRIDVGYWWWELEHVPEYFRSSADLLDEVWAPTGYIYENLRHVLGDKVRRAPVLVDAAPACSGLSREDFGLPTDATVFLVRFDFFSSAVRKNPEGAIEAFRRAFPRQGKAVLLVKTTNGDYFPERLDRLHWSVRGRPDIRVWDESLDDADNHALTAAVDCFVSLHRAEGLGLNIAEAMALGKCTIATAYSGNMDICTEETTHLIPFTMVAVSDSTGTYLSTGRWAEPDLDAASAAMRRVVADQPDSRRRGQLAREHIETLSRSPAFAEFAERRFEALALAPRSTSSTAERALVKVTPNKADSVSATVTLPHELSVVIPASQVTVSGSAIDLPPAESVLEYGRPAGPLRRWMRRLMFTLTRRNLDYARNLAEAVAARTAQYAVPAHQVRVQTEVTEEAPHVVRTHQVGEISSSSRPSRADDAEDDSAGDPDARG